MLGIARTLFYEGRMGIPFYTVDQEGCVCAHSETVQWTFFREYQHKLRRLYEGFYTQRGRELAMLRQQAAEQFWESLLCEVGGPSFKG